MTPPLFLVDELPEADSFELTGEEGRHAARVRRLAVGESLVVGDGRGGQLDCIVTGARPDGLVLAVLGRRHEDPPDPRLIVVQALPKGERAELAVETMTELGVDEIVPWAAARSVTRWEGVRGEKARDRWQRTAREAAKQSRRAWVPVIATLARTAAIVPSLVLHEDATVPLASVDLPEGDITLVVGPEGGIDQVELAHFTAAGAVPVRLGAPVLRTSTAGAAALAALSVRLGRWS